MMIRFHEGLAHGKSKAEALRDAELAVMRQPAFHNPFY